MPPLKAILDECVDRRLSRHFGDLDVVTTHDVGWDGLKNGELLKKAEESFDVFITVDRNLSFQQNIPSLRIAVIVLSAKSNRLSDLVGLVPKVLQALPSISPGSVLHIS